MGALIGSGRSLFVMSFEGDGRRAPMPLERKDINTRTRTALDKYFRHNPGILLDARADNALVGPSDIVKLDVEAGSGFSV
jgi:hypothetical protein